MILLIDNYDSFVFNLARYFERLGQPTRVVRNDAVDVAGVRQLAPAAVVFSPGPCTPNEAGATVDIIRHLHRELPMLGVCLGHQAIAAAWQARVVRAAVPVHGRTAEVEHNGQGIFADIEIPLVACRYHSLTVDEASLPTDLEVSARTADGTVMAISHRSLPVVGVQFHPESILTSSGYRLLANFLDMAGLPVRRPRPEFSSELRSPVVRRTPLPSRPVTF